MHARRLAFALAAVLAPAVALADTPPLASGTTVKVSDISKNDGYYGDRQHIVGLTCTVGSSGLNGDGTWYAGEATCGGQYYYFYQVQVTSLGANTAGVTNAAPAAPHSWGPSIKSGTSFVVADISPEDAYYSTRGQIIGQTCTASGQLSDAGGAWYGGSASCANGQSYYFYKASLAPAGTVVAAPNVSNAAPVAPTSYGTLPGGTVFTVTGIDPADAYYASASQIVGLTCTSTYEMVENSTGLYGGDAICSDGVDYYFYEAAVSVVSMGTGSSQSYPSVTTNAPDYVTMGSSVTLREIGSGDSYYGYGLEGLTCTAASDLYRDSSTGWMSGDLSCSDGGYYSFYQVAFDVMGGPGGTVGNGAERFRGESVKKGRQVQIVDISPSDAYYSWASSMIGQQCKVKKTLQWSGDGWYSGTLKCDSGKLEFYQVAVYLQPK